MNIDKTNIPLPELLGLHGMGFKLILLAYDAKTPCISSTNEIYNNGNYWTSEKIEHEYYRFKNVATIYGKTHLKDEQGKELYLNELDIDSKEAFTRLAIIRAKNKEYIFIDEMCKLTYVVQTRKKHGYRIYWLSHTQHQPIRSRDCKIGHEFEIKTDNTSGHGTLPPSRHRDDLNFHYRSLGQDKIAIRDRLYDGILKLLSDCLKVRRIFHHSLRGDIQKPEKIIILTDNDIQHICDLIIPYYKRGKRHEICYTLSGVLFKSAVHIDSATSLIRQLAKNDEELGNRLVNLAATYKKNRKEVSGYNAFYAILLNVTEDDSVAKNILVSIDRIVNHKKSSNEKESNYSLLEKLTQ
jgi:hypothetical protein